MSSSIFSSEHIAAYRRLRKSTRAWHAALVLGCVMTIVAGLALLSGRSHPPRWHVGHAEILFVGSSRVRDGIALDRFSRPAGKVYLPALDLATGLAALEHNLELWPRLSHVFLEVSEFTLLADTVRTQRDNPAEICGLLGLDIWELPSHADSSSTLERVGHLAAGRGLQGLHPHRRLTIENWRRRAAPETPRQQVSHTWKIHEDNARTRIRYARTKLFGNGPANAKDYNVPALLHAITKLHDRGIEVTLLTLPCSPPYEKVYPPEWRRIVDEAIATVHERFGRRVAHRDFRGDDRFALTDFHDTDHLSARGARWLSEILAGDTQAPATPR